MNRKVTIVLGMTVAATIAFGAFLAYNGFFMGTATQDSDDRKEPFSSRKRIVPVTTEPLRRRTFEERIDLQGTVEGKDVALVPPRIGGTIEAIFVDEGDTVIAKKTVLFETDSLSAKERVEIARRELGVAKFSVKEKSANRDRVEAHLRKVSLDYHRFERLLKKKAVTKDAVERLESAFLQASADVRHAESLVELGMEQERLAAAALAIAEKGLADASVLAPISGRVSKRYLEIGERGTPATPVLRIESVSVVEISVFIPGKYYDRVLPGTTKMQVRVGGRKSIEVIVSYKSPTFHRTLRTFEVKGVIDNPPPYFLPGAMAAIGVILKRQESSGVRRESIVKRRAGPVVFYIDGGVARMARVTPGMKTGGYVEILGDELPANAAVVTMGQFLLDEGVHVREEH